MGIRDLADELEAEKKPIILDEKIHFNEAESEIVSQEIKAYDFWCFGKMIYETFIKAHPTVIKTNYDFVMTDVFQPLMKHLNQSLVEKTKSIKLQKDLNKRLKNTGDDDVKVISKNEQDSKLLEF